MITPAQARQAIRDRLTGLHPNLTIYTGVVPEKVPTWGTTIKPYIGVWITNSTDDPYARALSGLADTSEAVRLRIQTQIVAADEPTVYEVADLVTTALTNHLVGTHPVLPDTHQQAASTILTDRITPSRSYLPLLWTLNTQ